MKRITIEKICVTAVLAVCYALMPQTGYGPGTDLESHLTYIVSHANIWHLTGNLFVVWIMTRRLYLLPSAVIAVLMSFLPSWSLYGDMGVTMGFSGVIFSIFGIKWGAYCRYEAGRWPCDPLYQKRKYYREFAIKALPFALAGILIPHVNWCIHTYCILAGFVYGRFQR